MKKKFYMLLALLLLVAYAHIPVYAQDVRGPILPLAVWQPYSSEAEALSKAESTSLAEQRQAAVTLFLLSRTESNAKKSLELVRKSSEIINKIYRRNRSDMLLALLSGMINLATGGDSPKLKDKISYSNRGLANFDFVLPSLPGNLEARQIYLRSTIAVPTFFRNLTVQQLQQVKEFLAGYEAGLAKLPAGPARERLEELKTHVLIIAAQLSQRKRKTRKNVAGYLAQVDTSLFELMKKQGDGDLVELYQKLKK